MRIAYDEEIFSPRLDFVFKSIFTQKCKQSKIALMDFISDVIDEQVVDVAIHENEPAVSGVDEKQSNMDINCTFNSGEQANIEIQVQDEHDMGIRAEYNVCKLHGSQGIKGKDYNELKRTFQITITDFKLINDDVFFSKFIYCNVDKDTFTIKMLPGSKTEIYLIELPKLKHLLDKPIEELSYIEMWALFFKYADDSNKRDIINNIIDKKEGISMASEVLQKIAKDYNMTRVMLAQEKAETDKYASLARARNEGMQQGMQQGIEQGKIITASSLLKNNVPIDIIVNSTGLSLEEIRSLQQ